LRWMFAAHWLNGYHETARSAATMLVFDRDVA
jgi:hypothetical protein